MNIFALHSEPSTAALMQADKHVVKMVLETAQILSTVIHLHGDSRSQYVYRKTHEHHPCVQWAAENTANYDWLVRHFIALSTEYEWRYIKRHKSWIKFHNMFGGPPSQMDIEQDPSPFALAMPDQYKFYETPVECYRAYYVNEKVHLLKYTRRTEPEWIFLDKYNPRVLASH